MRERFEQQMEILHTELIELGALCEHLEYDPENNVWNEVKNG